MIKNGIKIEREFVIFLIIFPSFISFLCITFTIVSYVLLLQVYIVFYYCTFVLCTTIAPVSSDIVHTALIFVHTLYVAFVI